MSNPRVLGIALLGVVVAALGAGLALVLAATGASDGMAAKASPVAASALRELPRNGPTSIPADAGDLEAFLACIEDQGIDPQGGKLPGLDQLRDAYDACRDQLPAVTGNLPIPPGFEKLTGCMADNGVPLVPGSKLPNFETLRKAAEACADEFGTITWAPEALDIAGLQECLADRGYSLNDPLKTLKDPAFQEALRECAPKGLPRNP